MMSRRKPAVPALGDDAVPHILAALLLIVASLVIQPRAAAALDAESLKRDIEAGLKGGGTIALIDMMAYDEVLVSPAGAAYRVGIRGLKQLGTGDGIGYDWGTWSFNVTPLDGGLYRVDEIQAPGQIGFFVPDFPPLKLAFRIDRFVGTWAPSIGNLLELDTSLRDLALSTSDGLAIASLTRLDYDVDGRLLSDGRADQSMTGRATAFKARIPEIGRAEVADMEFEASVQGFDYGFYTALAAELGKIDIENAKHDPDIQRSLAKLLSNIGGLFSGLAERVAGRGIEVFDTQDRSLFSLDGLELDFGANGIDGDQAKGKIGVKQEGLTLNFAESFVPPGFRQMLPRDVSIVISADQVPAKSLWDAVRRYAAELSVAEDSMTREIAGRKLKAEVSTILLQAGPRLSIPHFVIDGPTAGISADGTLEADAFSAGGYKGMLNVALTGIDEVMALLGGSGTPDDQAALGMLFFLKSMAHREAGTDGRPVDRLALELTQNGQLLLNGQPFGIPGLPPPATRP